MLKQFLRSYFRILEVMVVLFVLYKISRVAMHLMNKSDDILNFAGLLLLGFGLAGTGVHIVWFFKRLNK
jgi:hypothetical protein